MIIVNLLFVANHSRENIIVSLRTKVEAFIETKTLPLAILVVLGVIFVTTTLVNIIILSKTAYSASFPDVLTSMVILVVLYWIFFWCSIGLFRLNYVARWIHIITCLLGILLISILSFFSDINPWLLPKLKFELGFFIVYSIVSLAILLFDDNTSVLFNQDNNISEFEMVENFVAHKEVASFIYNTSVVLIGYILIRLLSKADLPFVRSILFMLAYVVLILLLQPLEGAMLSSDPFKADLIQEVETFTPSQQEE